MCVEHNIFDEGSESDYSDYESDAAEWVKQWGWENCRSWWWIWVNPMDERACDNNMKLTLKCT
jgi:hypothetical protein